MIHFKNLTKIYKSNVGSIEALKMINLILPKTGMIFVTGKSGSGKTTLLNVLGGLDKYEKGELIVLGKNTKKFTEKEADSYRNTVVGFVFQDYNLFDNFTVAENILLASRLQGRNASKDELDSILRTVGLERYKNHYPKELSGGQKQKVAIARTLIKNCKMILADEPTGALDNENGRQVMEILKKLSYDKLVVVVTHNIALAEQYADRIIDLKNGQIESDETITIDADAKRTTYSTSKKLVIKKGIRLDFEELRNIQNFIEHGKDVTTVDNINIIRKPTPKLEAPKYERKPTFKKTKLHLIHCLKFISNIFKNKVARLIITIVLCSLSFSIFGIFNSMAIYDENRLVVNTLTDTNTPSILTTTKIRESIGDVFDVSTNVSYSNSLKEKTNFDTKNVYNSYYVGTAQPTGFNNNVIGNKYYYYKNNRGVVEFDENEFSNYGFSIIKGVYPTSFEEIMISEYYANCMVNWQFQYLDSYGNAKTLQTIDEIINNHVSLTIGYTTSKQTYRVSGILKTGDIPNKFDDLKENFDSKSTALKNEYLNYLNNSFMLYYFAKPGFAENCMKAYNALPTYVASTYNFYFEPITEEKFLPEEKESDPKIEVASTTDSEYKDLKTKFMSFEELNSYYTDTAKNQKRYLFFREGKQSLNKHEVLLDVHQFLTVYSNEIDKLISLLGEDPVGEAKDLYDNIVNTIDTMKATKEMTTYMTKFYDLVDDLNTIYSNWAMKDPTKPGISWLEKMTNLKQFVLLNSKTTAEMTLKDPNYTIVGFYFNVNCNSNESIIMNLDDMSDLGINLCQGIYSFMVCTNLGKGNFSKLADELRSKNGTNLECQNSAISLIKINSEFFQQLSTLFLAVSGVFALFSIIMFANLIASSIHSKKAEIGILRALGARGLDIFKMFVAETLIISAINAIASIGIAYLGSTLVNMFIRNQLNLFINISHMGWQQILIMLSLSLGVGIFSAIVPIYRISKQKPIEAIRTAE